MSNGSSDGSRSQDLTHPHTHDLEIIVWYYNDSDHQWVHERIHTTSTYEEGFRIRAGAGPVYERTGGVATPGYGFNRQLLDECLVPYIGTECVASTIADAINQLDERQGAVCRTIQNSPVIVEWHMVPTSVPGRQLTDDETATYHLVELSRLLRVGTVNADELLTSVFDALTFAESTAQWIFRMFSDSLLNWFAANNLDPAVFIDRFQQRWRSQDDDDAVPNEPRITTRTENGVTMSTDNQGNLIAVDIEGNVRAPGPPSRNRLSPINPEMRRAAMNAIQAGTYERPRDPANPHRITTTAAAIAGMTALATDPPEPVNRSGEAVTESSNYRVLKHTPTNRWHLRYTAATGEDKLLVNAASENLCRIYLLLTQGFNIHVGVQNARVAYISVPDLLAPLMTGIVVDGRLSGSDGAERTVTLDRGRQLHCRRLAVDAHSDHLVDVAVRTFLSSD